MASKTKIAEIIATIKAIYPYYAKDTDIKITAKVWELTLNNIPDDVTEAAFLKCIQTCKMPPTPADVIEKICAMVEANNPTDTELWDIYVKALNRAAELFYRFHFTFVEANGKTQGENARDKVEKIWQELPERIKNYLGGKSEFLRMARDCSDEELKFEKTKFLKTLSSIKESENYSDTSLLNFSNQSKQNILKECSKELLNGKQEKFESANIG